jgi:predicted nucleic acid-binding protein
MAQQAGCRVLFSEDLQEPRQVEGILVVNPFRQN